MSRNILLPFLLAAASGAAAAQGGPLLGPPAPLPGDATIGPAGGQQKLAQAAGGAGVHLVAWADDRSNFGTGAFSDPMRDIYARLFDDQGQPLDVLPFRVSSGAGGKSDPRVAWNGAHFLVTWQQLTATPSFYSAELLGVRIAPDGSIVDPAPISIRKYGFSTDLTYAMASDGSGWDVIVLGTSSGEADLEGWSIAADGSVSLSNAQIFPTTSLLFDLQLCFDGSQYLFTWGQPGVQGLRLNAALAPIGGQLLVASGSSAGDASLTSDGDGWLVSWTRGGTGAQIQYRQVFANGTMGAVSTCNSVSIVELNHSPSVVWTGAGYTLSWMRGYFDPTLLYRARISAAGTLLDFNGVLMAAPDGPADPVVSSVGNGDALISWTANVATPAHRGDIMGAAISQAGQGPVQPVSSGAPRHVEPHLAPGGGGYLATFASEREGSVSILAQRLDAVGGAIDAEPFELASGDALGSPRAAWNGQHFFVVWEDLKTSFETDDEILGLRVGADGSLLDAVPFPVMLGKTPGVDAVGDVFLVAASTALTTELFLIHGVRVDAAGVVLDASPLVIGNNYARWPEVASFGDRWAVAWQRNPTHDDPASAARARVVMADGSMTPETYLGGGSRPSVGASSSVASIAWSADDILVQRMSPSGALIGSTISAGAAAGLQTLPSIAWDGQRFVLAWEDERNVDTFFDTRCDIYAMRVAEDGMLLDPTGGFAVSAIEDDERMPVVAGQGGTFLIGLDRFVEGAPYAAMRFHVAVGGDTGCTGDVYCTAKLNSLGCIPTMSFTGTPSLSASTFTVRATNVLNQKNGLLFWGEQQAAIPFDDGTLCVLPPLKRTPLQSSGGNAGASDCSGQYQYSFTAADYAPIGLAPGSDVSCQFWSRDPVAASGTGLTDAVHFVLCQ